MTHAELVEKINVIYQQLIDIQKETLRLYPVGSEITVKHSRGNLEKATVLDVSYGIRQLFVWLKDKHETDWILIENIIP
jgi:hypothetical protein